MKPLKLTMQAFGSYVTPGTIDFERTEQNLFLITGDTGAGKTTIFDAIVFALYGEASSGMNKKNGNELQSQYADPQISPFVELTFSEGDGISRQIYTVRRTPRHIRPVKRGHGTTGIPHPAGSDRIFPKQKRDGRKNCRNPGTDERAVYAGGYDRTG